MTFDDRFLTPQTARALLSWRIVLAAMIGLVAALLGMSAGLAAGLGLAVYAATVLAAMPRDPSHHAIDPFALSEPWRRFVQSAQRSRNALHDTLRAAHDGPLKDRLTDIARRLDEAIAESWAIAKGGDEIDAAVRRIDPVRLRSQLETLRASGPVRRRRRRSRRSSPSWPAPTAEGVVGEHGRPAAAHPGAPRRTRRSRRRGQRRPHRLGRLRERRRQPRDRARSAAPSRRRDERDHLKGRALAVVIAAALVVGAFFLRRDVIEGDDAGTSDSGTSRRSGVRHRALGCLRALVASGADVACDRRGRRRDARPARRPRGPGRGPPLWVTIEPYPGMVDSIRGIARTEPLAFTTTPLGASQLGDRPSVRRTARGADDRVRHRSAVALHRRPRRGAVVRARRRRELGHRSAGVRRRRRLSAGPCIVRPQRRRLLRRHRDQPDPLGV